MLDQLESWNRPSNRPTYCYFRISLWFLYCHDRLYFLYPLIVSVFLYIASFYCNQPKPGLSLYSTWARLSSIVSSKMSTKHVWVYTLRRRWLPYLIQNLSYMAFIFHSLIESRPISDHPGSSANHSFFELGSIRKEYELCSNTQRTIKYTENTRQLSIRYGLSFVC